MKKLFSISVLLCLLGTNSFAILYDIDKDPQHILYGNLSQSDPALRAALGDPLAAMTCGPVAVTNSFRYLENKYTSTYGNNLTNGNLVITAVTLANMMGTTVANGTYADDLIWGKYQYIEQRVPGATTYEAQYWPTWAWTATTSIPSWVLPQAPTWQWLWEQLISCEDVEILLTYDQGEGGHFVTVKSFHFDDINNDGIISASEQATIDFIDPATGQAAVASIYNTMYSGQNAMYVGYGTGSWVTMAVKESIPEPVTVILLGFGALMLRRKQA